MSEEIQQTTETNIQGTSVQLQLADLLLAAQVIQLAAARGAIKAEEMNAVGGVYERIVTFLQASGALTPADAAANSTDSTEASAE